MPDRDGKLDPRRAVRWADHVTVQHQHSLADLENVLLADDRWNHRRLQHQVCGRIRAALVRQLYIVLCGAPLVVFLAFTTGRWWGTTHRYSAGWAYPTAAAGGVLGIAVLSMFFARWFRQRVRLRGRLARSEERRVGKESGCWRRARNGKRRNKTGRRADRVHNST